MTKNNKMSNARETVYDRCAYVGCYNGKFINGRRLFHFPAETDRRLEMWIERSGNFRLRTWAATSLRKAGICGDHFDDRSFTNATKKALRRNVVPRHYTEDREYRKANKNNEENNKNAEANDASEGEDDPANCDRLSPSTGSASNEQHANIDNHDQSSFQSGEYFLGHDIKKSPANRSPSPVVEFIVEELDESLVCDDSESNIEEPMYDNEAAHQDATNCELLETSPMSTEEPDDEVETAPSATGLTVNRSDADVRTYFRSKNHRPMSADGTARVKSEIAPERSEQSTRNENATIAASSSVSRVPNGEWENRHREKTLSTLREENQKLKKKTRLLRQNLRRTKVREATYMKTRDMLNNIDEFLNIQECYNPVARAMVKLALHKNRIPYTKEERDFATQLYRHSSTAFIRMRRAGCNFPGKSTVTRWIAEDDGQPSTCDFMNIDENCALEEDAGGETDDGDDEMLIEIYNEPAIDAENEVEGLDEEADDVDNDAEEIDEQACDINNEIEDADEEVDNIHENVHVIRLSADNMNDAVEDAQEAIDDLVEHLEVVIDDSQVQEEYVQVFPPDDEEEDDFK